MPLAPRRLKVVDEEETLSALLSGDVSIGRLGDGEQNILLGLDTYFQEYQTRLARKLLRVLRERQPRFLVGLYPTTDKLALRSAHKRVWWDNYSRRFAYLGVRNHVYYSACFSRVSSLRHFKDAAKTIQKRYFDRVAEIWQQKAVVLVNSNTEIAGHRLFEGASRRCVVQCRAKHAFREYDELRGAVLEKYEAGFELVLLSVGPTATVMAHDLFLKGVRALDIGQITRVYDEVLDVA